jgi:glyoxylase-like metal-dependent hydrolase (beta-lactamase superfamily II)/rhodanese-related sulfurtransferase
MYIEQLYTGCLAEAAYYIESNGEAAIIDPIRETTPYLALAEQRGAKIKYVFETHFHADFVSGHIDLAKKTGATIIFGPNANPLYDAHITEDGDILYVGNIKIKVLHTPGHTMESTTYLLIDEHEKNHAIFTGDTLFIGDVGRPDLAVKSDLTERDLAGHLYDSLQNKILTLDDDVIVYPAHGAGSQCGKNLSDEKQSTVGQQRQFNYALQPMTKEQFIDVVTDGLVAPPAYFPENVRINKSGYENIDHVMDRNLKALSVEEFKTEVAAGAIILDTRIPDQFEKGFVKGAYSIGLDGTFAVWVGTLFDINQKMVLVTDEGKQEESVLRLARVGFENVAGYLKGGVEAWSKAGEEMETVKSVKGEEIAVYQSQGMEVMDVRRNPEFDTEHIEGALNIPLKDLEQNLNNIDKDKQYLVHCLGGYRSMIASSILKRNGINNFVNVWGGWENIKKDENAKLVTGPCPTQIRDAKMAAMA